jgi:hypothetical protein
VKEKIVCSTAVECLTKKTLLHFLFLFFCSFALSSFFYYYYTVKDRSTHTQITAEITRFLVLLSWFRTLSFSILITECYCWTQKEKRERRRSNVVRRSYTSILPEAWTILLDYVVFICQSLTSFFLPVSSTNKLANFKIVQFTWSKFKIKMFNTIRFFVATFTNWTT